MAVQQLPIVKDCTSLKIFFRWRPFHHRCHKIRDIIILRGTLIETGSIVVVVVETDICLGAGVCFLVRVAVCRINQKWSYTEVNIYNATLKVGKTSCRTKGIMRRVRSTKREEGVTGKYSEQEQLLKQKLGGTKERGLPYVGNDTTWKRNIYFRARWPTQRELSHNSFVDCLIVMKLWTSWPSAMRKLLSVSLYLDAKIRCHWVLTGLIGAISY